MSWDQSSTVSGWAYWSKINNQWSLTEYGFIDIDGMKPTLKRLTKMCNLIDEQLEHFNPKFIVLEEIQKQQSLKVFKLLAQVQGICFALFTKRNIAFVPIEATAWRSMFSISGNRESEKEQAILKVKELFGIEVRHDTAEAILIGIWMNKNYPDDDE